MMEKYGGLAQSTSSKWVMEKSEVEGDYANTKNFLEVPTGKVFEVITIKGKDQNIYSVIEITNWVAIAGEVLRSSFSLDEKNLDRSPRILG